MDWVGWKRKILDVFIKYKYAIGILVLGIALLLIPGKSQSKTEATPKQTEIRQEEDLSEELAHILTRIQGAGQVEVLLTKSAGEQTVYQEDADITAGKNGSHRSETVIITDADRNQSGLIQQINPPKYLGAVVVCQGADSPAVKLAIVEAVSKVTGLGADRISVLKMK